MIISIDVEKKFDQNLTSFVIKTGKNKQKRNAPQHI